MLQACALSLLMFTGASQFAMVGVIRGQPIRGCRNCVAPGIRNNGLYGLRPPRRSREPGVIWAAVLVGSLGCYLSKLAGLPVPQRVLDDDRVTRFASMLAIALLGSLMAIETLTAGHHLTVDVFGVPAAALR